MDFKIVFIDDNMSEKEPFVQNIRKHYKDADCNHVFQNPDKGLEYVLENLNSKMIVFIDWNFSGHHKKGIDLLKEIRQKTSLLYIVIIILYICITVLILPAVKVVKTADMTMNNF